MRRQCFWSSWADNIHPLGTEERSLWGSNTWHSKISNISLALLREVITIQFSSLGMKFYPSLPHVVTTATLGPGPNERLIRMQVGPEGRDRTTEYASASRSSSLKSISVWLSLHLDQIYLITLGKPGASSESSAFLWEHWRCCHDDLACLHLPANHHSWLAFPCGFRHFLPNQISYLSPLKLSHLIISSHEY